jgi:hypothetical protein
MSSFKNSKLVIMCPFPQYMTGKCCCDEGHITNFQDSVFSSELSGELDSVEELLDGWGQNSATSSVLINIRQFADQPDCNLKELSLDGQSFWLETDPVHCVPELYTVIADAIFNLNGDSESEGQPPAKRQRLESIVVMRKEPLPQKPNPKAKHSWSSGILPPINRGGRGGGGWGRGTGGWQPQVRGRGRGWGRRPFRGSYRGR